MSKILISYATRAGSTAQVAAVISERLDARGFVVDVKPVKATPSLKDCDAVILGSAIRMGNWLPEMFKFIQSNQAALNALPVALFTVHMLNMGADEASRAARKAYTAPVRALLPNASEVFFNGVIDLEKLSFLDRLMVNMVKPPLGNYLDWDNVRTWSSAIFQETFKRSLA